jgi:hypothetical protein
MRMNDAVATQTCAKDRAAGGCDAAEPFEEDG